MYEPKAFRIRESADIIRAARAWPLAMLIAPGEPVPSADLVPFVVGQDALRAHVARANPLARLLAEPKRVLVAFVGPQAYVSPSFYPSKQRDGRVVPTWNYVMIQATGVARLREEAEWIAAQVDALTAQQEQGRAKPWRPQDAPEDFVVAQQRLIVGIEIAVESWAGKAKMSQNRTAEDREGVISGLSRESDWQARAVARYIDDMQDQK